MYFPVVELIKKAYDQLFIWVGYLFWWHPMNRQLVRECEKWVGNPIKSTQKDIAWLKLHKASKWAWFDYWCGMLRGLLVCAVIVILIIEKMVVLR
jgi:hypothetical protein